MNTADFLNALFEFIGGTLTWLNVRSVYRARGYVGITLPAVIFFTSWGCWNLWFYPHLGQDWSFHAGLWMFTANIAWLGLMLVFGQIKPGFTRTVPWVCPHCNKHTGGDGVLLGPQFVTEEA